MQEGLVDRAVWRDANRRPPCSRWPGPARPAGRSCCCLLETGWRERRILVTGLMGEQAVAAVCLAKINGAGVEFGKRRADLQQVDHDLLPIGVAAQGLCQIMLDFQAQGRILALGDVDDQGDQNRLPK